MTKTRSNRIKNAPVTQNIIGFCFMIIFGFVFATALGWMWIFRSIIPDSIWSFVYYLVSISFTFIGVLMIVFAVIRRSQE